MSMPRLTDNRWNWTKKEIEIIVNKMIITILDEIVNYKGPGGINSKNLNKITDVEKQTPLAFQQRFFLLMDVLAPSIDYARLFIKREHPEMLYLFNWLVKLYIDEAEITSSIKDNNNVE